MFFNYASAGNEIYNNVFYIKSGLSPTVLVENDGNSHKYNFFNNIIYNNSGSTTYSYGAGAGVQTRTILNNVFYGNHPSSEPSDANKLTSNPLCVNPGTGASAGVNGINTLSGYQLQATSPAKANGRVIANNGGFDFFGNALPATAPDRGIHQVTTPLPVKLIRFDAKGINQTAKLDWTTDGVVSFSIDRKSDCAK